MEFINDIMKTITMIWNDQIYATIAEDLFYGNCTLSRLTQCGIKAIPTYDSDCSFCKFPLYKNLSYCHEISYSFDYIKDSCQKCFYNFMTKLQILMKNNDFSFISI